MAAYFAAAILVPAILVLFLVLWIRGGDTQEKPNSVNELVLGDGSTKTLLSFYRPVALGGITRESLLSARSNIVLQHSTLLKSDYVPFAPIFAGIRDGAS